MKQRVALFLSFAMAFTSVDSSVLVAAADTTEIVSEETQQEDAGSEDVVQNEDASEDLAMEENGEAQLEEADLAEDELLEESEFIGEEENSEEEQLIGEELYELDEEAVAVEENAAVPLDAEESFADSVASATPLEFGTNYTVELNAETTYKWFCYTAEEETTVVFQSTTENDYYLDTYGEVYDANGEQITYNDDGAGNGKFLVKVTVPAGATYYFKARMFREGNEGTFQVSLNKSVGIESITVKEASTVNDIAGLTRNMGFGTVYTIHYADGREEDATISSGSYNDPYGNVIIYRFITEENATVYGYKAEKPKGIYTLMFWVNGTQEFLADSSLECIDVEDANLPELQEGTNTIKSGEDDCIWYRFAASKGKKYHIDKSSYFSISTKKDGEMKSIVTGNNAVSFIAEQTGDYYLGFQGSRWDSEKQEHVYEWTANLQVVPEIESITAVTPASTSILTDLESNLGYGTEYTINYSDGTEDTKLVNDYSYRDSYGNNIIYRFKQENSENTYGYWDYKPEGKYALSFLVNEVEVASTEYVLESIDPEKANLPELQEGANTIKSGENSNIWYKVEAKADIKYLLDECNYMAVYTKKDGKMEYVTSGNGSVAFKAEQAGAYYLGFQGSHWDSEKQESVYEWTANLQEVPEIVSITPGTLATTSILAGLQSNLGYGTEYTISYSNGTDDTISIDGYSYQDSYGNYISYRFKLENSENTYDYWTSKPEGKYALSFRLNGEEDASTDYIFESIDVERANLPELTEGENVIKSGKNSTVWYQFKASANTRYVLDTCSSLSVYTKQDGELKCISGGSNGAFQTEQEGIYYLGFLGRIWINGQENYEWTTTLNEVPQVTSITIGTCKTTKIISGLQSGMGSGTEYTINYSDGTSESLTADWRGDYTDPYKNYISGRFIPENDEENWYYWTGNKPEGKYALAFYVDGEEKARTEYIFECIDVEKAELPELKTGKNTIHSGEGDYNWYRFKAEETGKYRFSEYGDEMSVRRYNSVDQEWESLSVSRGGFKAEKNETYYIGFKGENEIEDDVYSYTWETQLSKVQGVKSISVTPKKTSFMEDTNENHALFSLKLIYDDGTEFTCENWRDSRYNVDGKGNGIEVHIVNKKEYEEADSYEWYSESARLQAGTYILFVELMDDDSVRATYYITIEEEPSPFNHKADVIPVTMGTEYPVELNADKLSQWFSYTADQNIEISYQSTGEVDTYGYIYDAEGEQMEENDDDGDGRNFKITKSLKAGETYYFKARLYNRGNKGKFAVSFREKLQIASLTVTEHDLKSVYLKNENIPDPSVLLTATYNKAGVSETFYKDQGDSYGNEFGGEVKDADGNVVEALEEAGIYTYWVKCGEVTAKVGEFEVKSVKDLESQEVTEDAEQQIDAEEQRMTYHFTVKEAGIYQLNANVEFGDLRVYDTEENELELSGTQNGYIAYATLQPGEYYVVAEVAKEIKKLRVTVKKAALPQEVTAVFDGTPLIAGLDSLNSSNLSTRVKYTDNTTAWIAGTGSDSYGNGYAYDLYDGEEDGYWGVGDTLPAGTYTVKPVVFRTGTCIYGDVSDDDMLKEVLKDENRKATTVEVVKPDTSGMTVVQENEWVTVTGNSRRYFYRFTPQESGTYIFEYNDDTASSNVFCRDYEYRLSRMGRRAKLTAGQTYVVVATRAEDYDFRIVKYEKNTSGTEKETKTVQSFQISSVQSYVLSYDIYEPLSLKVAYTDGTTAIVDMPQVEDEDDFWSISDGYGNSFMCKEVPEITQEQNGKYVLFTVVCKEKEATLKLPYYTLEEKATEVSAEKPVRDTQDRYFKITPQESGEYIFRITSKEWGPRIYGFRNEDIENSFSYADGNSENWQTAKTLSKGKTYYFKVVNDSDNQNLTYTVSVIKPKNVSDLKITGYAKDYKVFEGITGSGNTGIRALVTYEDGSTETVTEYQVSGSGRVLDISEAFWVNTQTYRVIVKFGKYSAHMDIPASALVYTAELKEDVSVASNGDMNVYSFTPSETGVYQIRVQGSGYFRTMVYNSNTLKALEEENATYELLANTKYNVVVYRYNGDNTSYSVTAGREQQHTHKYVESIITKATCETAGYKQQICSICGKVKEGSRTTIPATGHTWQTVVDAQATCGTAGSQHQECAVCHAKGATDVIPATGRHSFGSYVTTKAATVLEKGTETRTCGICGKRESRDIAQIAGTMKLTVNKLPLQNGKSVELSKIVTGLATGDYIVSYTTSNKNVAIVTSSGKVTGKAAGSAKITIALASGLSATVTINVQKKVVATTSIKNLSKTMKLTVKEKKTLIPVINPVSTTDKLTYKSSNKKIVAVSGKGVLTAKKAGKAKVTVQSGKKKFVINVTVTAPAPTGMKNVPTAKTLKKGKTFVLKPALLPAGAQGKITYKSSNKKVATVDAKGKVKAKGKGEAVISVTAGKAKMNCKITVK